MAKQKTYIAIDLKSFYASVECKERNRDPLTTNLVVYRLRSTEEEAGGGRRKIRTGKAYARSNAEYQKEVWQECCVEGNEP